MNLDLEAHEQEVESQIQIQRRAGTEMKEWHPHQLTKTWGQLTSRIWVPLRQRSWEEDGETNVGSYILVATLGSPATACAGQNMIWIWNFCIVFISISYSPLLTCIVFVAYHIHIHESEYEYDMNIFKYILV
jgi:hypothetical protein